MLEQNPLILFRPMTLPNDVLFHSIFTFLSLRDGLALAMALAPWKNRLSVDVRRSCMGWLAKSYRYEKTHIGMRYNRKRQWFLQYLNDPLTVPPAWSDLVHFYLDSSDRFDEADMSQGSITRFISPSSVSYRGIQSKRIHDMILEEIESEEHGEYRVLSELCQTFSRHFHSLSKTPRSVLY